MGQRKRKRTLAETRRRRFLVVLGLLAMLMIALSPLLVATLSQTPQSGPQLLP